MLCAHRNLARLRNFEMRLVPGDFLRSLPPRRGSLVRVQVATWSGALPGRIWRSRGMLTPWRVRFPVLDLVHLDLGSIVSDW